MRMRGAHGVWAITRTPASLSMVRDAFIIAVSWYRSERDATSAMRLWMISLAHSLQGKSVTYLRCRARHIVLEGGGRRSAGSAHMRNPARLSQFLFMIALSSAWHTYGYFVPSCAGKVCVRGGGEGGGATELGPHLRGSGARPRQRVV